MAEQDAELFKILIRQIGEDAEIDPVLGEALRVLPETELLKPLSDLLHRGPSRSRGTFDPRVDLAAKHHKINRLGQKRLSTALRPSGSSKASWWTEALSLLTCRTIAVL
jgi:hypothetical protein